MKELSDDKLYVTYLKKNNLPFDPNKIEIILGDPKYSINKPLEAFWGSPVDAQFGWKEWCEVNFKYYDCDYDWDNPIYFKLKPNSTILRIDVQDLKDEILGKYITKDEQALEELRPRFNEEELSYFSSFLNHLDFNKVVADGIDAVELMDGNIGHYYFMDNDYQDMFSSWDCQSIVILNKSAICFEKFRIGVIRWLQCLLSQFL